VTARHDYHPFGEEIGNIGGRSNGVDAVRKQFAGYEGDKETDLDFAQARYFASSVGRFFTPDTLLGSGRVQIPQSWNRLAYALGNPLRFVDPTGMFEWDNSVRDDINLSAAERARRTELRNKILAAIKNAHKIADEGLAAGKISQKKYDKINNALNAYGTENDPNGVTVGMMDTGLQNLAAVREKGTTNTALEIQDYSPTGVKALSQVKFSFMAITANNGDAEITVVHEGQHVLDNFDMADFFNQNMGTEGYMAQIHDSRATTQYGTENNAFHTQSYFYQAIGQDDKAWGTWKKGWGKADEAKQESNRQNGIDKVLRDGYGLDSANQGANLVNLCSKGNCFK
jgi:RHS repeat-associated protein